MSAQGGRSFSAFIEDHPLSVIVSVAIGAFLLGAGAASWVLFNGYVPNQLYSLQTQLNDCRGGKQVSGAGKNVDESSTEWPALTTDQINSWAEKLRPHHLKAITVFWSQEVEAKRFFRSLQALGKQLNCDVKTGLGQADSTEIEIQVSTTNSAGPVLVDLFKSLNWPVKLTQTGDTQEILIFIPQRS